MFEFSINIVNILNSMILECISSLAMTLSIHSVPCITLVIIAILENHVFDSSDIHVVNLEYCPGILT